MLRRWSSEKGQTLTCEVLWILWQTSPLTLNYYNYYFSTHHKISPTIFFSFFPFFSSNYLIPLTLYNTKKKQGIFLVHMCFIFGSVIYTRLFQKKLGWGSTRVAGYYFSLRTDICYVCEWRQVEDRFKWHTKRRRRKKNALN